MERSRQWVPGRPPSRCTDSMARPARYAGHQAASPRLEKRLPAGLGPMEKSGASNQDHTKVRGHTEWLAMPSGHSLS